MVAEEKTDNVIRVSRLHTPSFYIRAATQFLQGVTDKETGKEKKIFDTIVISALGAAIPTAAQVSGILEKNSVGKITKVETQYTELEFGKRPQVLVTVQRNKDYVAPPPKPKGKKGGKSAAKEAFKDGPPMPERLGADKLEKKMKKVTKEGGKRGVEIEGAADMGGLQYFCTKVLEPAGDLDMLVECVKAMNAKSDPTEEERKGGSGRIGKVVTSYDDKENVMCVSAYVPFDTTDDFDADEWLKLIIKKLGNGLPADYPIREDSNSVYAQVTIKDDKEKGIFAIKLRDYVIQHANGVLTEKNLIPEAESDDDDEMCFGDDDFDM